MGDQWGRMWENEPNQPTPNKQYPRGGGVKIGKFIGGFFIFRKKNTVQGVRHQISLTRVCYANNPEKGGYMATSCFQAGMGRLKHGNFWVTLDNPRGPVGWG